MATGAFHGGAFFDAIGSDFSDLSRRSQIINADVLDAWYPPSPKVVEAIQPHLEWLIQTSPPTESEGLTEAIAAARNLRAKNILVGSGSSSLMYMALPSLVESGDEVLILDPMYGEYIYLLESVIGAKVRRHNLDESRGFLPDVDALIQDARGAKFVAMVNPNSPTGRTLPRSEILCLLQNVDPATTVWIDETYIDFLPGYESAEPLTTDFPNLIISKSMSKYYGLSGLRLGYLVASTERIHEWSKVSPPWSVGLIAQVAGVAALADSTYYRRVAQETAFLRNDFSSRLGELPGLTPVPSDTNFLLLMLDKPRAQEIVDRCRESGIFLRNCDSLSPRFQGRAVRTAVKTPEQNELIIQALARIL
jgi:histidinol-phosphate/aromatic aminotransferase/cobyric acid decarboxylase-like protein